MRQICKISNYSQVDVITSMFPIFFFNHHLLEKWMFSHQHYLLPNILMGWFCLYMVVVVEVRTSLLSSLLFVCLIREHNLWIGLFNILFESFNVTTRTGPHLLDAFLRLFQETILEVEGYVLL